MLFNCQLYYWYFNIENWLSVYYDYRFAESVKLSVFFSVCKCCIIQSVQRYFLFDLFGVDHCTVYVGRT